MSRFTNLKGKLNQDERIAMILESKDRSSLRKCSCTINIRYFAIKDSVEKHKWEILHFPTYEMLGIFSTKPLQGAKFPTFRSMNFGVKYILTTYDYGNSPVGFRNGQNNFEGGELLTFCGITFQIHGLDQRVEVTR